MVGHFSPSQEFRPTHPLSHRIKKYITNFGGDPDRVTIYGASAGGQSVVMQMLLRNGTSAHFTRGIAMSGSYTSIHDTVQAEDVESWAANLAKAIGCDPTAASASMMACMRAAPVANITAAASGIAWRPTVDGVTITDMPYRLVKAGKIAPRSLIIGTATTENAESASTANFSSYAITILPHLTSENVSQIAALYPASDFAAESERQTEVFGDVTFICPSEAMAGILTATGKAEAYRVGNTGARDLLPLADSVSVCRWLTRSSVCCLDRSIDLHLSSLD